MSKVVDYYYTLASPWTYLGHPRFEAIARRHGATIHYKPVDYGKIFPLSGGLPLGKGAPQRQACRLAERQRWRDFLGIPLTIKPKFTPSLPTSPPSSPSQRSGWARRRDP